MYDNTDAQGFPAIAFGVRSRLYAFQQRGTATLLPWLQRYAGASPAPSLPQWCLGLLNVRGTVQMAVDLGNLLGHGPSDTTESSRLIFIEHGLAQLGLLVDSEIGVRTLMPNNLPEDAFGGPFATSSAMLESHPVTVLDGSAIIRHVAKQLDAPIYII
ncbi:MAG: Chemotaxis protein [Chloroflexi bacterium]|jgi:chemotaxis signal transduction protein|nr:Chemotaxis protein [Chloroflexota bacterium]MDB5074812.1 Chemotaxis protein [Chloroflexota bacterium]